MASPGIGSLDARIEELKAKDQELRAVLDSLERRRNSEPPDRYELFSAEMKYVKEERRRLAENARALNAERVELAKGEKRAEKARARGDTLAAVGAIAGAEGGPAGAAAGAAIGEEYGRRGAAKAQADAQRRAQAASKGTTWQRMRRGYNDVNDRFMAAQDNAVAAVKGAAVTADKTYHPWLFAFVCLFIHVFDVINQYDRGYTQGTLMFVLYMLVAIYASFFYYRTGIGIGNKGQAAARVSVDSVRYFFLSVVAFALPYVLRAPFLDRIAYLPVILALCPVWFLYIALHEPRGTLLHTLGKWIVNLVAIALLIIALATFTLPDHFASAGVDMSRPFHIFWNDLKDAWATITERITNAGLFNPIAWRERINTTFNPAAQLYAGQVEQNKQEPHGVYITELRSLYPENYLGTDPVLLGRIEAKTFMDGGFDLTPSCRLERTGKPNEPGNVDVEPPIHVNYLLTKDVTCRFDAAGMNLSRGTYNGVLGVAFDFETWGYITNTFVSRDLIEQYYRQGRDIRRDLGIDRQTGAIYTNGPVEIGVSASEQPIDIDLAAARPVQQHFGFTVRNRWTQGRVAEVKSVVILVPEPFELAECVPVHPRSERLADEEMTKYTFLKSDALQMDPRLDYSTIDCQLLLPTRADAERVLAFGEKTPVTFVVIARYAYEIEKKTRVRVVE